MTDNTVKIQNLIEEMTKEIRRMHEITKIYYADELIKKIGGTFILDNKPSVRKTGEDTFQITLKKRDRQVDKLWQAAYPIGKLYLDMGYESNSEKWQNANECPETTQNYYHYFAGALLMPKDEFIKIAEQHFDSDTRRYNTKQIAEYFHVGITHASLRGVQLKLFRSF